MGTINFTASPHIYPENGEILLRESVPRDERVAGYSRSALFFVLGKKLQMQDTLNKAPMVPECSRQFQYPQCNSGQCVEFPVDIGSEFHSPSISSASTMTLI